MNICTTERLTLRQFTLDDAPFILELLNDPAYIQNISDKGVRTIEDARGYIHNGPIASYQRFGFGLYLVLLRETGVSLGMCGLIKRDTLPDVDIGFAFLPQYRANGYAFEAASAVMAYGRDTLKLERIIAIVSPNNNDSIKLLLKLGLKFDRMIQWADDGSELKLFVSPTPHPSFLNI